jgi:hypothetical protein
METRRKPLAFTADAGCGDCMSLNVERANNDTGAAENLRTHGSELVARGSSIQSAA